MRFGVRADLPQADLRCLGQEAREKHEPGQYQQFSEYWRALVWFDAAGALSTENEFTNELTVTTDVKDYAPGETEIVTADGLEAGAAVEVQVQHIDGAGADRIQGTADDLLDSGLDGVNGTGDDGTGPNLGNYPSDHGSFAVTDGVWWWEAGAPPEVFADQRSQGSEMAFSS